MARVRNILSDERGFTIVEMLSAAILLIAGIAATFTVFTSSKNLTLVAQRHEIAVHQAQKEMERLRAFDYQELGLTSAPSAVADSRSPGCRVTQNATRLRVLPVAGLVCNQSLSTDEGFVLPADAPEGVVDPGPETFYAGEVSGTVVSGKVYRYITWRDENCPPGLCLGEKNTKRLFVAVTIDPVTNASGNARAIGPRNPIWITSIATDPNEGVLGQQQAAQPPPPATSAQSFYLYDKRCSDNDTGNGYSEPPEATGSHAAHDTASPGTSCENTLSGKRPDLMGPVLPDYSYSPPAPPHKFSSDLSGDFPAGIALPRVQALSTCPVSAYQLDTTNVPADNDVTTPGKYQVHAWATKKFSADFDLNGTAFLSMWTTSVDTSAGTGNFCATLIDRRVTSGVPNDVVLGSMSRSYSPWPTTKNEPGRNCGPSDYPCGRQLTFTFSISSDKVRSGGRLMLLLSILSTSGKDIVFLYDDPRYRTLLEIETNTPCNGTGLPCSNS